MREHEQPAAGCDLSRSRTQQIEPREVRLPRVEEARRHEVESAITPDAPAIRVADAIRVARLAAAERVETVRDDEPRPILADPSNARGVLRAADRRRRHIESRHAPAPLGEPQRISALAATYVERGRRCQVADHVGEGRVHPSRPHAFGAGVVLLPVCVPLFAAGAHRRGGVFGDECRVDGGARHRTRAHRERNVPERCRHVSGRPHPWVTRGAERVDGQRCARQVGASEREAVEERQIDRGDGSHEHGVDRVLGAVDVADRDERRGSSRAVATVEHERVDGGRDHTDAAGDQPSPHIGRQRFGERRERRDVGAPLPHELDLVDARRRRRQHAQALVGDLPAVAVGAVKH